MYSLKHAPIVAAVLVLTATTAAHAVVWKLICNDGNPQAVVKAPGKPRQPISWATCDATVDGVCEFTVENTGCGCALKGCCGSNTFMVPVGRSRLVQHSFSPNLRLRCRPCPVTPFPPTATCPGAPPS